MTTSTPDFPPPPPPPTPGRGIFALAESLGFGDMSPVRQSMSRGAVDPTVADGPGSSSGRDGRTARPSGSRPDGGRADGAVGAATTFATPEPVGPPSFDVSLAPVSGGSGGNALPPWVASRRRAVMAHLFDVLPAALLLALLASAPARLVIDFASS